MEERIRAYKEEMAKWNKRATRVLVGALVVCILSALDIWRIWIGGDFIINPYLTIFLTFGSFLLIILTVIAKATARKYLREAEETGS